MTGCTRGGDEPVTSIPRMAPANKAWTLHTLRDLWQDLRYAWRTTWQRPGFHACRGAHGAHMDGKK